MKETVLTVFATVLGAIVGSFLNACIHRLPRGIGLDNPRRSFCPSCKKTIPWYENLPVVSWICLRGKCSSCGTKISPRYVLVELLTAAIFAILWISYPPALAIIYWVFFSLLIAATFIDIEHFIIPDEITWGGTIFGVIASIAIPALMGTDSRLWAAGLSVGGAALGFGLLWLVVEGGKLAFGRKRHSFGEAVSFEWKRDGDRADLLIGEDSLRWEDIFSRETDTLSLLEVENAEIDGTPVANDQLRFRYNVLMVDDKTTQLDDLQVVKGTCQAIIIPREAMGFGDVKFIAAIGAFLGWQAVLFTFFAASIIGCVAGVAGLLLARDKSGARLPFGPFLALGAAWWLFGGRGIFEWYLAQFGGNPL